MNEPVGAWGPSARARAPDRLGDDLDRRVLADDALVELVSMRISFWVSAS